MRKFYRISRKANASLESTGQVDQVRSFVDCLHHCLVFLQVFVNFPCFLFLKDDLHGAGGEITVQKPDYVGMGDLYLKAAEEMGYSVTDLNGRNTQGACLLKPMTKKL
jgi:hypothetical protein